MKTNPELSSYIRTKLKNGEFAEKPTPRHDPKDHFLELSEHQSQERQFARDACDLVRESDEKILLPAIHPGRRLLAIVEIEPPQRELPWTKQAPGEERQRQHREASRLRERVRMDEQLAQAINAGRIRGFSDLVGICGTEEELKQSLRRIGKYSRRSMQMDTIDGVVDLNPEKLLLRSVADEGEKVCRARMFGHRETARGIEVKLKVLSAEGPPMPNWTVDGHCSARLETANNARALSILKALYFLDADAELAMGTSFELATQKWTPVVRGFVDEAQTLKELGALAPLVLD